MQSSPTFTPIVRETLSELERLLDRQQHLEARDKVAALYLLKIGRANNYADLARIIGQEPATLATWVRAYCDRGLSGLLLHQPI